MPKKMFVKKGNLVLYRPVGKGNIDPKVIRDAVRKVRDERLKAEAEAKAEGIGSSSPAE